MAIQALDLNAFAGPASSSPTRSRAGEGLGSIRVIDVLRFALALMVVAQLGRIPVLSAGGKDAPVLINDLLIVSVFAAGTLAALRRRSLIIDGPAGFGLAFAAVGGLSAALAIPRFGLSPAEFIFSIAYLVRWLAYFGVYLVVINFTRPKDIWRVWRSVEGAVLVFSGFGIFQSLFLPNFAQMVYRDAVLYKDWDPQGYRLVSTFLDPNFAGALIAMVLLVSLAMMVYGVETPRWKLFILFAALALTVSRGAVVAFLAGMMCVLCVRGLSRGLVRFVGLGTLLALPFLPLALRYAIMHNKFMMDESAMSRVFEWGAALQVFMRNPVIGVGFNTYGFVQARYWGAGLFRSSFGLNGGLLFIAVLTGVVGLAFYGGMILRLIRRCRTVWRDATRSPEDRGLCLGAVAVTVALVTHSFFLNTLFYPFLMEPLWVLWGLTFVVLHRHRMEDEDERARATSEHRIAMSVLPTRTAARAKA